MTRNWTLVGKSLTSGEIQGHSVTEASSKKWISMNSKLSEVQVDARKTAVVWEHSLYIKQAHFVIGAGG